MKKPKAKNQDKFKYPRLKEDEKTTVAMIHEMITTVSLVAIDNFGARYEWDHDKNMQAVFEALNEAREHLVLIHPSIKKDINKIRKTYLELEKLKKANPDLQIYSHH